MRHAPTPGEATIWELVRARRTGPRWRRQVPMLGYIVDFYCAKAKCIVEIDGLSHTGREAYDARRDDAFRTKGIATYRFSEAVANADSNEYAIARAIIEDIGAPSR